MELTKEIMVNAPADKVWKIVGADFNEISEWSSFVITSEQNPGLPDGGGRVCDVKGFGETVETLYEYDDEQRELAFTLEGGGTPFFMREVKNSWHIEPDGEDKSRVQIGVQAELMPVFKQLMTGRLTKVMEKRADVILGELKYFAENGEAKQS
ncbi:MAG: SRPBCC family protein [Chloroflexi bacterium]|nr:MAG: SRPBCC family protein [Chloroflexota bacterium]MBL1196126.1 SRPBCC family protein [Chloroflexota bacterium]NOH13419.1 SRPBCC family protein [Chloroflexota bacterium]